MPRRRMLGMGTTEIVGSLVLDPKPEDEAGPLLLGIGTDELEGVMLAEDEGTTLDPVAPEPPVSVGVGSAVGAAVSTDVAGLQVSPPLPPSFPPPLPPWLPDEPFEPLVSEGGTTTV
ncbi:hypothetical protein PHISCL_00554 [Aspergillus sclerotialis]|uniref:Uncharacterized protein n=1 Tax=Aspergillus sclerotialis TaxID=2070753 RepID=A0A3A3A0D9_9EURO|nr:hypothetical protein PHISCL_00554 [Aspergillus sclerotialis]